MRFQTELLPATLIRRYKRFLADCTLVDGREITAHVGNPGSMMGLAEPGTKVWLEPNDDPKRKLKYTWRLTQLGCALVGVDPGAANGRVREALDSGLLCFDGYTSWRSEVKYGENSRVDFLLSGEGAPDLYLEVKAVTLSRNSGVAEFPDSVTKRGAKHLAELAAMVKKGHRAALLYVVQRSDADIVRLASDIDSAYATACGEAQKAGVSILAWDCDVRRTEIKLRQPISVEI